MRWYQIPFNRAVWPDLYGLTKRDRLPLIHPCCLPDESMPDLTLDQARALLLSVDCTNPQALAEISTDTLRHAVLLVVPQADYHIFGVCAETAEQGYTALCQYAAALGDPLDNPCPTHTGPIYIKFNTRTGLFHSDDYVGEHRGILVSCQSAYEDGINDLFGHLPLDLFADG